MKNSELPEAKKYSQILPDLDEWPIIKLSRNRAVFEKEVLHESLEKIISRSNGNLEDTIARALFLENIRLSEQKWSTDPDDDKDFWNSIKDQLLHISQKEKLEAADKNKEILANIITRYTREIAGRFSIRSYQFAQRVLNIAFYPLLNAPAYLNFLERKYYTQVQKRIHLSGEIESLRKLAENHTLVLVPTHFSNLDSVTVGWASRALGLPALLYGAGLNLFGIKMFSFFMNRIGAYKVDRRKKNLLYLETLKTYSTLALHRGCHSMFFPYGDRSYSGSIGTKLKLGLLGTALEAQYLNLIHQKEGSPIKKIIIIPVVLNYHFVLEAPFLIDEYLKATGKENYINEENDQFSSSFKILKVMYKMFTKDSEFLISFGKGMDVFGNQVDDNGKSFDHLNREINIRDYFTSGGLLKEDTQRNSEYVRMLGEQIVRSYLRENTVFSSHLVCFSAFEIIRKKNPKADIYDLMRLPESDRQLKYLEFRDGVNRMLDEIRKLSSEKKLKMDGFLENELGGDTEKIIAHGMNNAGIYHADKIITKNEFGDIQIGDMKLLYYYHNRLTGYELEKLF